MTLEESEYLTIEETKMLREFLKHRNLSYAAVGRMFNKAGATVGNYWFDKNRFKRLIARELVKKLKEKALEGFDEVEKI